MNFVKQYYTEITNGTQVAGKKIKKEYKKLIKEMNEILKEAGATETQIEWGIDLPTLSWKEEKRMCQLETELKDVLVEMAAVKGAEEALKRMEDI